MVQEEEFTQVDIPKQKDIGLEPRLKHRLIKMADNKQELKRVYNIPLRKEWLKTPKYKRAKKAVTAVKEFLVKHMKSENIKLGQHLNKKVWARGIKNPPHHVEVNVTKDAEGVVKAELVGFEFDEKPVEKVTKKVNKKDEKKVTEDKGEVKEEKPVKAKPKSNKKGKAALKKELEELKDKKSA